MSDWQHDVLDPVEGLLERWAADGNEAALAVLLPGWRANNGLTDGWFGALEALRSATTSAAVAAEDAAVLRKVADRLEHRLRHRK